MSDQNMDDQRNTHEHDDDPGNGPTTTHAERGAGEPRLRISRDGDRTEYRLEADTVRIGSAEGNELRLADTDPVHVTITHDDRDEYVMTMHGAGETNANTEAAATHTGDRTETLRTGARFTAGPWTLVFAREEFADHGRPFGGRAGGEYSDQPLQPSRPEDADGEDGGSAPRSDSADQT